ncbi:MAG: O-antigen ligase family protein [Deltaproteobacteria bacterium]
MTTDRLSSYTLTLGLGLSALGAGAIHLAILAPFALLVISSALLLARSAARSDTPRSLDRRVTLGAGVWFVLAGFCLLQCVPLPAGLLGLIAPDNADIWSRSLRPLGLPGPTLASISLAPGRTVLEALKAATYGLVFVISARIARRHGLARIATIAFAIPLAVAVVTAAHRLLDAERLYGTFELLDAYSVAPLLNANSRAGFLNLGFFCGLGLLLDSGARPRAAFLGMALTFLAAEVVLCESRGGTGCLALGLVLMLLTRARSSEFGRPLQLFILLGIGAGATFLAWSARRSPLGLDDRSLGKLDLCARAWKMATDHFGFGIGRGAFGSVFAAYQGTGHAFIAEHVENFPLQWATEWGVPVTLLAFGVLAWVFTPVVASGHVRSTDTHRGLFVGAVALLLQNVADLGLELPAVAALLVLVLGGMQGSFARARPTAAGPRASSVLAIGALLGLACLGCALRSGVEAPSRMRRQLHDELAAIHDLPTSHFWSRLRAALGVYPAEPYFPLLGASAALAEHKDALPWITRALERNPTSAEAHVELARILHAGQATGQALGALRRSIELEPDQAQRVLTLATGWGLSPQQLTAITPDGRAGGAVLALLAYQTPDVALRVELLEQALQRQPELTDAQYRLAQELLDDVRRKDAGSVCKAQRDGCLARASEHAARGAPLQSSRAVVLEARILVERGQAHAAEEQLFSSCQRFPADVPCAEALVDLALANSSERLSDAARRVVAAACVDRERCANAETRLAHKFAATGRLNVALSHFERAAKELPSIATWQAVATTAQRVGQRSLADDALRQVRLLGGVVPNAPSPAE